MNFIEIKAPAKINIGLNIVEKRNDGFHNLETFFYPINDLFDTLTFQLSDSYQFYCDNSELNNSPDNLVTKAKKLLEDFSKRKLNVKIELKKRIPTGAGLGGGSSDAAATLISLNELFKLQLPENDLYKLALELGSDVPFFIKAKPAVGKLRGEKLTIKDFNLSYHIVLVNPGIHISTKKAFSNINPQNSPFDYEKVFENIDSFLRNIHLIKNDFEDYVFETFPEIQTIKTKLHDLGAEFSLMSGSGSTVYGFFSEKKSCDELKNLFPPNYLIFNSSPISE